MKRLRSTGNKVIGFGYKPTAQESLVLQSRGLSQQASLEPQHYTVTPEGDDMPDPVADYALNLYSTMLVEVPSAEDYDHIQVAAVTGQSVDEVVGEHSAAPVVGVDLAIPGEDTTESTEVEVTGEEEAAPVPSDSPRVHCLSCDEIFTGKTIPAAKASLTRHMKAVH